MRKEIYDFYYYLKFSVKVIHPVERYYVSKKTTESGLHEVHKQGCRLVPPEEGRLFLGILSTSNQAVMIAKNLFRAVCPCSCCLDSAMLTADGSAFRDCYLGSKVLSENG